MEGGDEPLVLMVDDVQFFKCRFCRRTFNKKANCKIHMRIHTGELPYACSYPGCGKRFMWKSSVTFHETNSNHERAPGRGAGMVPPSGRIAPVGDVDSGTGDRGRGRRKKKRVLEPPSVAIERAAKLKASAVEARGKSGGGNDEADAVPAPLPSAPSPAAGGPSTIDVRSADRANASASVTVASRVGALSAGTMNDGTTRANVSGAVASNAGSSNAEASGAEGSNSGASNAPQVSLDRTSGLAANEHAVGTASPGIPSSEQSQGIGDSTLVKASPNGNPKGAMAPAQVDSQMEDPPTGRRIGLPELDESSDSSKVESLSPARRTENATELTQDTRTGEERQKAQASGDDFRKPEEDVSYAGMSPRAYVFNKHSSARSDVTTPNTAGSSGQPPLTGQPSMSSQPSITGLRSSRNLPPLPPDLRSNDGSTGASLLRASSGSKEGPSFDIDINLEPRKDARQNSGTQSASEPVEYALSESLQRGLLERGMTWLVNSPRTMGAIGNMSPMNGQVFTPFSPVKAVESPLFSPLMTDVNEISRNLSMFSSDPNNVSLMVGEGKGSNGNTIVRVNSGTDSTTNPTQRTKKSAAGE